VRIKKAGLSWVLPPKEGKNLSKNNKLSKIISLDFEEKKIISI
jgi:hypothetical protein